MSTSTPKQTPTVTSISPNTSSLTGNTQVTLTGSDLSDVANVNFGTAGATDVKVISDTAITAVVPDSGTPGGVDITLITKTGNQHSFSSLFTFKAPEITGLSPSSGPLAGNQTITVSGKYLTGCKAVNFDQAGASNVAVINDGEITVTNPNAPKDQTVHVTAIVQGQTSAKSPSNQFTYSSALAKGVPMVFKTSSDHAADTVWVQFIGDASLSGYYLDSKGKKQSLSANTAYSLAELTSPIAITDSISANQPVLVVKEFSGRIYINFGTTGLQNMSDSYTPSAGDSTDPNYNTRYQYFEPTIKNSQMNIDLSYIDFTAISLSLVAQKAPSAANPKQISHSSLTLATNTASAASSTNGSVLPSSNDQLPSASFARVISPQLAASELYHDFTHYLKTTLAGQTVHIAGTYVGTGKQPSGSPTTQAQSYDYKGTFDSSGNVTLTPKPGSGNGQAAGVPAVQRGTGVGANTGDIVIAFEDLNAQTGIYGCNAPYTLGSNAKTSGITNDIYGQVVGDLLAGLNFGYVGSKTPLFNNGQMGSLSSTEWWGGTMPDGTAIPFDSTPGGQGLYFDKVQSNANDYNSYAGSIATLTTGYGYPLQDRLGKNLMSMNTETDSSAYLDVYIDCAPST